MPVFTAIGTYVAGSVLGLTAGSVGFIVAQSLVAAGAAALIGNALGVFDQPDSSVDDPGVDQRIGANTQNRVPLLYGKWTERGILTYFEVTEDKQTLYAIVTLGEGPSTSIDTIYWDDLVVTLDADGNVTNAVDSEGVETDRLNGQINIQTYLGNATGNNSTYLEGLSTNWTSNHKMTNLVYAVITVKYNREKEVTGLADMRFIGTSPLVDPSDAVKDLLQNPRYGLGLVDGKLDLPSFAAAKTYFETMLPHEDSDGDTVMAPRYQVNGSISTQSSVQDRLDTILRGCNASLRWSEGKYSIFVEKAETATAFNFNDSNLVGSIAVTERGFASIANTVTVSYGRNAMNNWERGELTYQIPDADRYPNELDREVRLNLPLSASSVEAERAAIVLLNQSREQLTVKHRANITAFPLEAGDIVGYTKAEFGWVNKLFRIIRILEIEEEGKIEFEIDAIEYTPAVYADRMLVDQDASPNVGSPEAITVTAVSDLSLQASDPTAGVPSITLAWTVPTGAFITAFDVYANSQGNGFSSNDTFLILTDQTSTGGGYTVGDTVTVNLTGLVSGTYDFWVVARNPLSVSGESNTVTLANWAPMGAGSNLVTVYRFHNNAPTADPGAPTGSDGLGNGWLTESGNPHWQAVTQVAQTGATNRVLDFTAGGVTGNRVERQSLFNKEVTFDIQGTFGQLQTFYNPRPTLWDATILGQAAETSGGSPTVWDINLTGSSDATTSDTNEEFYIYLTGNSGDGSGVESFNETGVGYRDQDNTPFWRVQNSASNTFNINEYPDEDDDNFVFGGSTVFAVGGSFNTALGVDPGQGNLGTPVSDRRLRLEKSSTVFYEVPVATMTGQSSTSRVSITVDHTNAEIGGTFEDMIADGGVVTVSVIDTTLGVSTVLVSIPTESISESFSLPINLNTDITLRDSLLPLIQANTAITDEFTVTGDTSTGLSNIPNGSPIVKLVANDLIDHNIAFSFDSGAGDLTGSQAGSILDGSEAGVSTEVRITYDPSIMPVTQDIVLGSAADTDAIATVLAAAVDDHDELSATVIPAVYRDNLSAQSITSTEPQSSEDIASEFDPGVSPGWNYTSGDTGLIIQTTSGSVAESNLDTFFSGVSVGDDFAARLYRFSGHTVPESFLGSIVSVTKFTGLARWLVTVERLLLDEIDDPTLSAWLSSDSGSEIFSAGSGEIFLGLEDRPELVENAKVEITTDTSGSFIQPVISVLEQGTGDATFSVSLVSNGTLPSGTLTAYSIREGSTVLTSGFFPSAQSVPEAITTVQTAINDVDGYTATIDSGVIKILTDSDRDVGDLSLTITPGTNGSQTTSDNNLSASLVLTQAGSEFIASGGSDTLLVASVGTTDFAQVNAAGMTIPQVEAALAAQFTADGRYTVDTSQGTIALTATFSGDSDQPEIIVLNRGIVSSVDSVGTISTSDATVSISRTVIRSGQEPSGIFDGEFSTYSVELAGSPAVTGTFSGSQTAAEAAQTLLTVLQGAFSQYTYTRTGGRIRATSVATQSDPDLSITITPGQFTTGSAASISVQKTVVSGGGPGTINLFGATWNYFVINRGAESDDDTIMVDDSGMVSVRRGLIQDVAHVRFAPTGLENSVVGDMTITTSSSPEVLEILGAGFSIEVLTSANGDNVGMALDVSTDGGTSWTEIFASALVPIAYSTHVGDLLSFVHSINTTYTPTGTGQTLSFRIRKVGTNFTTGGWGATVSVVRELAPPST